VAKAPLEIRSLARKYTNKAIATLVGIMGAPNAPPAARVMAANSLLDRGWGKATQLVDVQGEVRQLVEVKLSVVQAAPAALPGAEPLTIEHDAADPMLTKPSGADTDNTSNINGLDDKTT
jgi:hypothetical protein